MENRGIGSRRLAGKPLLWIGTRSYCEGKLVGSIRDVHATQNDDLVHDPLMLAAHEAHREAKILAYERENATWIQAYNAEIDKNGMWWEGFQTS